MKEIKNDFRCFNYGKDRIFYNNKFHFSTCDGVYKLDPCIKDDRYYKLSIPLITMQATGLTDIHNIPLYEGDLFKSQNEKDSIIYRVWRVKGGFAINTNVKMWQKDILCDYPYPLIPLADEQTVSWFEGNCYIIGNIYENDTFDKLKSSLTK